MQVEAGLEIRSELGLVLEFRSSRIREMVRVKRARLLTRRRHLVEHAKRADQGQKRRRIVRGFDQREAIIETEALRIDAKPLKHSIKLR
jgi:hypothetical protein